MRKEIIMGEEIKINIDDWVRHVHEKEIVPLSQNDLVELARSGETSSDIAIAAIVALYKGRLSEEEFRSHKSNLYYGALHKLHQIFRNKNLKSAEIGGRKVKYSGFIGPTMEETGKDGAHYIDSDTPEGAKRAIDNMRKRIVMYITEQAIKIRANNIDVEPYLRELQAAIEDLIEELAKPPI